MKTNQSRYLYIAALLLGLAWIFVSADRSGTSTSGLIPAPQQGFLAPDFELQTITGETIKLSDLRGQAVLVNLWATWCPPCRAEMPAIEKVHNEYKDDGLVVLAVNMTYQDTASNIAPFLDEYGLTFPILLDVNNSVGTAYQLRSLPSSFFIDRDGIITEVVIGGPMAEALLRTRVEEILK
ncbi:MAG TPA: TlpA disulfide reductase family protein [Anaerolineales bacterium]|nr:TlpA disulfide reductase family protein [Anaerolineales bacterium]